MTEENKNISDLLASVAEPPEDGAEQFSAELDLATVGIDLTDHAPEHALRRQADADMGVTVPERPARTEFDLNNQSITQDPVADIRNAVEDAFAVTAGKIEADVTADERDRFVRCALHDTEMWFDVVIRGVEVTIRVAIPTESFTAAAAAVLAQWGKAQFISIESNMQWLLAFQQLHAWYQVREIAGEVTPWSDLFCGEKLPRTSELRKIMADPENFEEIFSMSAVRWRMVVEAMRIAEYKYKTCLEAWHDRSFFSSAGTA